MNILNELRNRFATALVGICDDPAPYLAMIRVAQDSKFGDYQANFAMPLAKKLGEKPQDLAARIIERLNVSDLCETPTVAGPGFINLKLKGELIASGVNALVGDDRLGVSAPTAPRAVVVDYSSPNIAKPMHVGHLRSSVIGAALYRILSFQGHRVISDNHIGDWGTQFGMILYGYKHFLDAESYRANPVAELARLYRLVNQLGEYHDAVAELPALRERLAVAEKALADHLANPNVVTIGEDGGQPVDVKAAEKERQKQRKKLEEVRIAARDAVVGLEKKVGGVDASPELKALADAHPRIAVLAREQTALLHGGDAENLRLWNEFLPECLKALNSVYTRLAVSFDHTLGESYYQPMLAGVVADLQAKGLATTSDGAVCVFIPGIEAPFIVRKTDGAFTYATTDLATIQFRVQEWNVDTILYVVDSRQSDHFKLLFETARRWGFDKVEYQHVSFGTVLGSDGKPYKTRSGDSVGLESLLDEGIAKAREVLEKNSEGFSTRPDLTDDARRQVAETVGIGAIKYADLSQNRESDYVFSWDKMLATNGDTATYMQYAYARVCGIFRKGGVDRASVRGSRATVTVEHPAERALALQLLRFTEAIDLAAAEYRPNFLTQYLFETANRFSTFFEQCPVVKAESDSLRSSRYLLADLTARVIACGLDLLGIRTIEQM